MSIRVSLDCTACGRCTEVCPYYVVSVEKDENGKPAAVSRDGCIKCGQCEAVCPFGALENDLLSHDDVCEIKNYTVPDAVTAEMFLRSRRSVRHFKNDGVPKELAEKLVNIGRYAQTANNSQGVGYLVVSPETMIDVKKLTVDFFMKEGDAGFKTRYEKFSGMGKDLIFRGAPMCILALTKGNSNNAKYALTYIELFAPSLGLGTCWAGIFEGYACRNSEELRARLSVPHDFVISGALLLGYPKYNYTRLTGRDKLKFEWR